MKNAKSFIRKTLKKMQENKKIVIDTHVLVSAILFPKSAPAKAVNKALIYWEIIVSESTLEEFLEVISRRKFDKYFSDRPNGKQIFIENFLGAITIVEPTETITDCKDPKDNQFLEIAISANARLLVTGDHKDLITMNPYRGLEILTAREFLENY